MHVSTLSWQTVLNIHTCTCEVSSPHMQYQLILSLKIIYEYRLNIYTDIHEWPNEASSFISPVNLYGSK